MISVTAYPLQWPTGWPRTKYRSMPRFDEKSIARTRDALQAEIRRLGGRYITISSNLRLRLDGLPAGTQKNPEDPGVAVYFELKGKPVVLACDRWLYIEDNLWAITKHIEALRGQERWGVGSIEQAFSGYAALQAAPEPSCWEILGVPAGSGEDAIKAAFRERARQVHPDVGGGHEEMVRLNRAYEQAMEGGDR